MRVHPIWGRRTIEDKPSSIPLSPVGYSPLFYETPNSRGCVQNWRLQTFQEGGNEGCSHDLSLPPSWKGVAQTRPFSAPPQIPEPSLTPAIRDAIIGPRFLLWMRHK